MSTFDNVEFAAGAMTGRRAFNLDQSGFLRGPVFPAAFGPGDNTAKCHAGSYGLTPMLTRSNGAVDHKPGSKKCACGFYAYYDATQSEYDQYSHVVAVIEGFGRVTIGDRGFRCEKARVVAVVKPPEVLARQSWPKVKKALQIKHRSTWLMPLLILWNIAWAAFGAYTQSWWTVGVNGTIAVLCTPLWWAVRRRERQQAIAKAQNRMLYIGKPWMTAAWDKFTKNYPDVKQYDSVREMVAAHPLTEPPPEAKDPPEIRAGFVNVPRGMLTFRPHVTRFLLHTTEERTPNEQGDTDPTGSEGGGQGT